MLQPYAVTCIRFFCSSLSEATFEATQAVIYGRKAFSIPAPALKHKQTACI